MSPTMRSADTALGSSPCVTMLLQSILSSVGLCVAEAFGPFVQKRENRGHLRFIVAPISESLAAKSPHDLRGARGRHLPRARVLREIAERVRPIHIGEVTNGLYT